MVSKSIKVLGLYVIIVILFNIPANADYHYASHDGSDEYPYTSWETGAHLIQDAIDAANPHDTLYIGAGEWYERVATEVHDSVAIIGMGMDSTFCYGDTSQWEILTIDYNCSVKGINFQGNTNKGGIRGRAYASLTIKDCIFRGKYGIMASGGTTEISNCVFDSCRIAIDFPVGVDTLYIYNNVLLNSYGSHASILVQGTNYAIIQNNIIINPNHGGIACNGYSIISNNYIYRSTIFYVRGIASSGIMLNNTIVNHMCGINSFDAVIIKNNSLSNCFYGITTEGDTTDIEIKHNNFWNFNRAIYGWPGDSIGNIFCNPMYVSDDDVQLQAFSPLIDAGDPNILDVDGTRSDIGCYGGPYGESYEYQDLPPAIPDSLSGQYIQNTIYLNWRYNSETDFNYYLLYKDTISGFEPSVFNQLAEPETSYYADTDFDNEHNYYYRIASVDNQDNISDYSEELEVALTNIWNQSGAALPRITSIKTNYPNPFNTSTTIVYTVANLGPIPAEIRINIYDIRGRKVRTLLNERRDIGEHIVIWDGRDDYGSECSSGAYFAKISQWSLELSGKPKKLVLIK